MSLDKAIKYGKEKREQYRRSKAFDQSCRNHGSCGYCEGNRTIQSKRGLESSQEQEHEYRNCFALPVIDEDAEPNDGELLARWKAATQWVASPVFALSGFGLQTR
jgi:hypothetical protein